MKTLVTGLLILAMATLPCQRAPAPALPVEAGMAVCVLSLAGVTVVVLLIRACEPKYNLVWQQEEGGPRRYSCTQVSPRTFSLQDPPMHWCQGPFPKNAKCYEKMLIANTNNAAVDCNIAESPGDPPRRRHATLKQTTDGGQSWQTAAVRDGWSDENLPGLAVVLGDPAQMDANQRSTIGDAVVIGNGGAQSMLFRWDIEEL